MQVQNQMLHDIDSQVVYMERMWWLFFTVTNSTYISVNVIIKLFKFVLQNVHSVKYLFTESSDQSSNNINYEGTKLILIDEII